MAIKAERRSVAEGKDSKVKSIEDRKTSHEPREKLLE